jgi:hypothetical protein
MTHESKLITVTPALKVKQFDSRYYGGPYGGVPHSGSRNYRIAPENASDKVEDSIGQVCFERGHGWAAFLYRDRAQAIQLIHDPVSGTRYWDTKDLAIAALVKHRADPAKVERLERTHRLHTEARDLRELAGKLQGALNAARRLENGIDNGRVVAIARELDEMMLHAIKLTDEAKAINLAARQGVPID